jgi:hypothetical protein
MAVLVGVLIPIGLFALWVHFSAHSAADRLAEQFKDGYGSKPWISSVDGIDVNGRATIVIHTSLDPLDPAIRRTGVEICEAMADTSPAEDDIFVQIKMLVPGEQNVDGSFDEPRSVENSLAEESSIPEDTCHATLSQSQIEAHREALRQ